MDPDFWRQRWHKNEIGFHERNGNPLLVKHVGVLDLKPDGRVFVPLCGKTLDIGWLLLQGYRVCGVELVEHAVEQLFEELGVAPQVQALGAFKHYSAEGVDIFVGDFFDLSADILGPVDAVFDRAALVALPDGMRERYAAHLAAITGRARQMLLTFEYDQDLMDGPPFSVDADNVHRHYDALFEITLVDRVTLKNGLKGVVDCTAAVWLLKPKA